MLMSVIKLKVSWNDCFLKESGAFSYTPGLLWKVDMTGNKGAKGEKRNIRDDGHPARCLSYLDHGGNPREGKKKKRNKNQKPFGASHRPPLRAVEQHVNSNSCTSAGFTFKIIQNNAFRKILVSKKNSHRISLYCEVFL